jgi:tetratricopeptide (TPR) repeat protein
MAPLFESIEKASGLFVRGAYREVVPLLEKILARDTHNLDAVLRLAAAYSTLGNEAKAQRMFERAKEIAPQSPDVRTYLALHLARGSRWEEAVPMLEKSEAEDPGRLPVLEALARIREKQGRTREAMATWQRIHSLRQPSGAELIRLGAMAMSVQETPLALLSFEKARELQGAGFANDLELGVLLLASRRYEDARQALDRVPATHPGYPMALFKRAQVSVLLRETDQAARIELARKRADATTRELIARERLFQDPAARSQ